MDLPVPDPFASGFPFSDGDIIPDDLLKIWWEEHETLLLLIPMSILPKSSIYTTICYEI
jgi:hypothetical protein